MNDLYSSKFFNYLILLLSVLFFLDYLYLFSKYNHFLNLGFINICLSGICLLSILSFLVKKMNKTIYSQGFILFILLIMPLYLLLQYIIDLLIYSINRVDLIFHPIPIIKFCSGIVLFYFSTKFSSQKEELQNTDKGKIYTAIGLFLVLNQLTKFIDDTTIGISILVVKLALSFAFIFIGIQLYHNRMTDKKAIKFFSILFFIYQFF